MKIRPLLLALLPVFALVLSACGATEPAATTSAETANASAISVTDSRGKVVTLNAPAERVVTLEWGQTEDVVTLGVQPVGVADPKGFSSWVTSVKLAGDPVDVGLRTEPSLESVAKADPDLILGIDNSIPSEAIAQMEEIAPVVLLKGADATRPLSQVREGFTTTAALLGKGADAERVLDDFDAKIADGRAKLASRGDRPFALAYPNVTGNKVDFRMHGPRSLPGAVAKELGLTNAYSADGDAGWGLGTLDVEGLTTLPADTTFLSWTNNTEADPLTGTLAKNAVWKKLPFVVSGQVKPFGDGIWLYGGPASLSQLVDAYVADLA